MNDNESSPSYSMPPSTSGPAAEGGPASPEPRQARSVMVKMPNKKPVVTYALIIVTILVYLLQLSSQYLLGEDYPALLGLKINELIIKGQYWRLISPILLHGSILHLAVNMYALNVFGPTLEKTYGKWRFLTLYLIGGLGGNVVSFIFSTKASLGASTAIFGLLGAEGVFLYQNKKLFGSSAQRALINIVTIAVINLVIGLSPGIDNWGHVGGLLGGTLFSWFAGPILQVEGIFPSLKLVDGRESRAVWQAGIMVSLIFIGLVAGVIYFRGG